MQTVDVSSARAEEAEEARLNGLRQRAPPGVGRVHDVFPRKTCPRSSSYHISHQRGCVRVPTIDAILEIAPWAALFIGIVITFFWEGIGVVAQARRIW